MRPKAEALGYPIAAGMIAAGMIVGGIENELWGM
jgi:hypothetical protein